MPTSIHCANIMILDSNLENITRTETILKGMFDTLLVRSFLFGDAMIQFLDSPGGRKPENLPNLILVDIDLPDQDGFKPLSVLQQLPHTRDLPVILHTGTWDFDLIEKGFKFGVRAIVPKFSVMQLKLQMERLLREPQAA